MPTAKTANVRFAAYLRIACEDQYVDSMLGAAYMEPDCRVRPTKSASARGIFS